MAMNPGPAPKKPRRRQLAALSGYRDWQLHDAKARSERSGASGPEEGPQRITVYGEDAVIVVSAAAFAEMMTRSRPRRSLHALLSDSPLRDLEFGQDGERSPVRDVGL